MFLVPTYLGPSPISGIGVFARESIAAGALVWEFVENFDREITDEELERLPQLAREYIFRSGNLVEPNQRYLDRHPRPKQLYLLCGDSARFMNHLDSPNLSAVGDRNYALCGIKADEELTCDYRNFDVGGPLQFLK